MSTKFRVNYHILEILNTEDTRIFRGIADFVKSFKDEIDEEHHFLLKCKQNSNLRDLLFSEINLKK